MVEWDPATERWIAYPSACNPECEECTVAPLKDADGVEVRRAGYALWWCPTHDVAWWGPVREDSD